MEKFPLPHILSHIIRKHPFFTILTNSSLHLKVLSLGDEPKNDTLCHCVEKRSAMYIFYSGSKTKFINETKTSSNTFYGTLSVDDS